MFTKKKSTSVGMLKIERLLEIKDEKGNPIVLIPTIHVYLQDGFDNFQEFRIIANQEIDRIIEGGLDSPEELSKKILEGIALKIPGLDEAEVGFEADYVVFRKTPVTRQSTQEMYSIISKAFYSHGKVKTMLGAQVTGITACPCAYEGVQDYSRTKLKEQDFSDDDVERIMGTVPVASHNQRNISTLLVETDNERISVDEIIHILEESMSSPVFEVLKRPDEVDVVLKAHRNLNFVEDTVRKILFNTLMKYPGLPDDNVIIAKSESLESIHQHNAFAERVATFKELWKEIGNAPRGNSENSQ